MTAKITISMPDSLKRMIDEYDKRHPFEPLIISQLAQKAVFEKIKAEDPELLTTASTLLPQDTHSVKDQPEVKAKQHTLEVVCAQCGEPFTGQRSTRKFCSNKCKAAYGRKQKK
ncbi:MAG TPA: hypothetical protein V6C97_26970 [Oculatellaceae cyanobacterium]